MMVSGPVMGKAMAPPSAGDASQQTNIKSQLKVQAVWHEQARLTVHAGPCLHHHCPLTVRLTDAAPLQVHQSRVSFLLLSEDGTTLFSACDAAAPKQVELPDVQAAAVSTQVQRGTRSAIAFVLCMLCWLNMIKLRVCHCEEPARTLEATEGSNKA